MTQPPWYQDVCFYHIYPLGLCGAPEHNDYAIAPVMRLEMLHDWLPHIQALGANALYLGPLFESTRHGYDTADYYHVDRRLGDRGTLARLAADVHQRGMRLVLDAVFNHVGRDFWAFRDVREHGQSSAYTDWFSGLRFDGRSPLGDPFTYDPWNGHYHLVRLNQANPAVREHLFGAVRMWVEEFGIEGLRLDAADCLDSDFMQVLRAFCEPLKADFLLLGEVIHGDYRKWANPQTLHSVTNYECYKGLYSCLNDRNFFEIAWTLNRQWGAEGMYAGIPLYNFVDNHDVDRIASRLEDPELLPLLYTLLFTIPGIPSIYYGSEWGIPGRKTDGSDAPLRPRLALAEMLRSAPQPHLAEWITRLAVVRQENPALRMGGYQQLHVAGKQLAFSRTLDGDTLYILFNAAETPARFELPVPQGIRRATDLLHPGDQYGAEGGRLVVEAFAPKSACILKCTNV